MTLTKALASRLATAPTEFKQTLQASEDADGNLFADAGPNLRSTAVRLDRPDLLDVVDAMEKAPDRKVKYQKLNYVSYVKKVVSFTPGAGIGAGYKPDFAVIKGVPHGGGDNEGSTDVLSLGRGGRLTVKLTKEAKNGLVVFENPFKTNGVVQFKELGLVEVSKDGKKWYALGQAGNNTVANNIVNGEYMADPSSERAGGDRFTFAAAGLSANFAAKYVRVTDLSKGNTGDGFDLDTLVGY